jgi:hypothetical protein
MLTMFESAETFLFVQPSPEPVFPVAGKRPVHGEGLSESGSTASAPRPAGVRPIQHDGLCRPILADVVADDLPVRDSRGVQVRTTVVSVASVTARSTTGAGVRSTGPDGPSSPQPAIRPSMHANRPEHPRLIHLRLLLFRSTARQGEALRSFGGHRLPGNRAGFRGPLWKRLTPY